MSQTCSLECKQITVMHTKLWTISHTHATHLSAHRINANGDTSMRAPSIINEYKMLLAKVLFNMNVELHEGCCRRKLLISACKLHVVCTVHSVMYEGYSNNAVIFCAVMREIPQTSWSCTECTV